MIEDWQGNSEGRNRVRNTTFKRKRVSNVELVYKWFDEFKKNEKKA